MCCPPLLFHAPMLYYLRWRKTPQGGRVNDHEVAHAIAWLLSAASSGVTGINLPVDAGFIAGSTWDAYGGLREAPRA